MNALFRLEITSEQADNYFLHELPENNNNFFYAKSKMLELKEGDSIYFLCGGYVKARAVFTGETDLGNVQRDPKYKQGYKLTDVEVIDSQMKLSDEMLKKPLNKTPNLPDLS